MQAVNCPACGAEIQFFSKLTVSLTCRYCSSLIVRDSQDIRNIGKVSALLDDVTPLQLFSGGTCREGKFQVIGRCRWAWDGGFWNEWFIHLGNGRPAWLAEAQGQYVVCVEDPSVKQLPALQSLSVDDTLQIGRNEFNVDDIKSATLAAFEGELPFRPQIGERKSTVDLSDGEAYACIEYAADGTIFTRGKVYEFEELGFTNLRRLEGW